MKSNSILFALLAAFCMTVAACSQQKPTEAENDQVLYRIQVGGKCGYINERGGLVIDPQFDRAYWVFGDGVCYAEVGDRHGLINTAGEFVAELDTSINWICNFRNGSAMYFSTNGNIGIISTSGEIILPADYKSVERDGDIGYIVEDEHEKQGYVNHKGEFIIPCRYDVVNGFNEGLMVVATGNKFGYVDTTGQWTIDTIYDDALAFGNGMARVKKGGKWMFIDKEGNEVGGLDYDEILTSFNCNRAFVKKGGKTLLIDTKGTVIAEIDADSVYHYSEGYATFKKRGKFGKLDSAGTVVIPATFERLYATDNGISVFEKNGKQGAVDTTGKIVVDAIHEEMVNFEDISILLGADNQWTRGTYYDRNGNLIWKDMGTAYSLPDKPTKEDWIAYFDSRMAELDPIEGLYYVTTQTIREDMETGRVVPAGSTSTDWYAVDKSTTDEYRVFSVTKPGGIWNKKFVKLRNSNMYAVTNLDTSNRYAEDYTLTLDNPGEFDFPLRISGNDSYNWYHQYKFLKEFPPAEIIEQVQKAEWGGTGFAIADGYIATNHHVVGGAKRISVKGINGDMKKGYRGFVVATDIEHDLAIIKIVDKNFDGFDKIPYYVGKSLPDVGDEVFALGYPMANTMGKEVKVTNGIISAASGYKGDQSMYQISAAVQPGNSGGPLFDNNGNVIGIVCAKHADAENANYAVKVSYLYSLINKSDLGIKMPENRKINAKSLSKKVKQVRDFVYMIECSSR